MTIPEVVVEAIARAIRRSNSDRRIGELDQENLGKWVAEIAAGALRDLPLPARLALASALAGPEHVVVPKERVERMWCKACGTVTRDDSCDCTRLDTGTQQLQNYADGLLADLRKLTASQAQEGEQLTEKDNV